MLLYNWTQGWGLFEYISPPNLLSSRFPHNEMVGGGGVKEFIYYFLQKLIEYIFTRIFKLLNKFIISLVQVQQYVNAKNV